MNTKEQLEVVAALLKSTQAFAAELESTSEDIFILKTGINWSISEITEHLCISDKSAYIALIKQNTVDENELKNTFQERIVYLHANDNIKLEAPDAAKPTGKFASVQDAVQEFNKNRQRIEQFTQSTNLDEFATGFKHPRLGYLKRFEWLQFITWHSNHHLKQIQKTKSDNRNT